MIRAKQAQQEFQDYLAERGTSVDVLTPATALDAAVAFYREVRASDCPVELDGDMLLCQWGTHDWGGGPYFEFDITRQLITDPEEDEDIRQLSITFRFTPDDTLRNLGSGNRWCYTPDGTDEFVEFIRAQPSYVAVVGTPMVDRVYRFEVAG